MKMSRLKIAITLGILCLILTVAISVQLKTMKAEDSIVTLTSQNNDLKDQVLRWKEKYSKSLKEYEETEKLLEQTRTLATQNDTSSIETEQKIKENNKILGLTDVKGNGIVMVLKDSSTATQNKIKAGTQISDYVVHDLDLIILVNELWNAGAQAISINNQRIISTTAISCDGNIIKINGETTSTPFEIKAIGEGLYGSIARPGGYFEILGETGINTSIKNESNISISRYSGAISSEYLKTK